VLSELLIRRSKDPRLAQVTVTRVDLTPDLRLARVAYTVLGDDSERAEIQRALVHATPFLKRGVGEGLALRYVPELAFAYDVALEGARRIDALLRGLKPADAPAEPGENDDAGADDGPDASEDDEGAR
jgi:ribosome-binding factor A